VKKGANRGARQWAKKREAMVSPRGKKEKKHGTAATKQREKHLSTRKGAGGVKRHRKGKKWRE